MLYRISEGAKRDLDAIFIYWAERVSVETADRVIDNITERFWILGEYPEAGRRSDEIARGVRCFPAGRYLTYYRKTRQGADILHVFHGARDQARAFTRLGHK